MATSAQVIDRFAPLTGLLPSTLDRLLRALRATEMVPTGGRGGGKSSAHYEAGHLAIVLLGLAGLQPSDGPEAVKLLRALPYRGSQNERDDVPPPLPTFEDQIAYWIEQIAEPLTRGLQWYPDAIAELRSIKVQLCLNPLHAIIEVGAGKNLAVYVYAADPTSEPALRRLTILSGDLLLAAAELFVDTFQQNNAFAFVQFLGTTPAKAGQEQKSAGRLRQEVPAPFSDQPRVNGSGSRTDRLESIRERDIFQGYAEAEAGTPTVKGS